MRAHAVIPVVAASLALAAPAAVVTPVHSGSGPRSAVSGRLMVESARFIPAVAHTATGGQDLRPGARGPLVRRLQQRLAVLKYYPGQADGRFGRNTLEAVWAFQETQGLQVLDLVNQYFWRALANPRPPRVLVHHGRNKIEVSLRHQVLVLYRHGQVMLVSHVSTGGGYYFCSPGGGCGHAITPRGNFRTRFFLPGWVTVPLGQMYNPVFFIGHSFAVHGDTQVPKRPVSHGCVRVPMDIARFFHTLVRTPGTPVYIRG